MVQEIAKEMIRQARQEGAQDIYLIPKTTCYELYMRIGDERRFIKTYDFEILSAVISHFKFVAGMNVGEKRRSQLGSCDYDCEEAKVSIRLSLRRPRLRDRRRTRRHRERWPGPWLPFR